MLLTSLDPATPDMPEAVRVGTEALSRADLLVAATAVADHVAGAQAVAIAAHPRLETIVAVAGCLIANVPVVPVPGDVGTAERHHILSDSHAELWLGPPSADIAIPTLAVDIHAKSSGRYPEPNPDDVAMIVYTSGTSGAPKGVALSHSAIAHCLDALAEVWEWTEVDELVHGLPLFHVHGLVLGVLGPLRIGSRLVHTVRPTPQAYAAASGSLYFGVPTVWSRVCADPASARALSSARLLISGSAALPTQVFDQLRHFTGTAPIERYGASETLITVSGRSCHERRPGWVGLRLPGIRTRLRDEHGDPVPHDGESVGEVQVIGPTLFSGYLGDSTRTAEAMTDDNWFRTGDLAVIDRGGFHRIIGRASVDMIKSGGYRIGAGEVEQALLSYPGIREVAVVGIPDTDLGQRIVAYVVGERDDAKRIEDFVASHLSVHKRPREIRFVEELPRNAMGKVQKRLLIH
ncbi:acyl-CoA synthetase [Nocardia sp. BSTN01]|uniref:acyl-CoA synthetase n=1 Tax=Nocardia sp. BSTN01 TaxID=2783665 RepID=UPI00188DD559|nr:acyl-CoA synthetase [Nocardia sp. BSTN01]MBF5001908.1 acyl-CoA synthetase [Nocardia sp. BSTN01]